MFDENRLSEVFGESDEGFRRNFEKAIAEMQCEASPPRRDESRVLLAVTMVLAACFVLAVPAFAVSRIFFDRNEFDVGAVVMSEGFYGVEGAGFAYD